MSLCIVDESDVRTNDVVDVTWDVEVAFTVSNAGHLVGATNRDPKAVDNLFTDLCNGLFNDGLVIWLHHKVVMRSQFLNQCFVKVVADNDVDIVALCGLVRTQ